MKDIFILQETNLKKIAISIFICSGHHFLSHAGVRVKSGNAEFSACPCVSKRAYNTLDVCVSVCKVKPRTNTKTDRTRQNLPAWIIIIMITYSTTIGIILQLKNWFRGRLRRKKIFRQLFFIFFSYSPIQGCVGEKILSRSRAFFTTESGKQKRNTLSRNKKVIVS